MYIQFNQFSETRKGNVGCFSWLDKHFSAPVGLQSLVGHIKKLDEIYRPQVKTGKIYGYVMLS